MFQILNTKFEGSQVQFWWVLLHYERRVQNSSDLNSKIHGGSTLYHIYLVIPVIFGQGWLNLWTIYYVWSKGWLRIYDVTTRKGQFLFWDFNMKFWQQELPSATKICKIMRNPRALIRQQTMYNTWIYLYGQNFKASLFLFVTNSIILGFKVKKIKQ